MRARPQGSFNPGLAAWPPRAGLKMQALRGEGRMENKTDFDSYGLALLMSASGSFMSSKPLWENYGELTLYIVSAILESIVFGY